MGPLICTGTTDLSAMKRNAIIVALAALLLFHGSWTAPAAELVMLEEDGCEWCDRWNEDIGVVYNKSREGQIAPLRRLDIHDHLPVELKFLVKGRFTPTFILVDRGREIGRIRGYPGEDFFWGYLGQLIDKLPEKSRRSQLAN